MGQSTSPSIRKVMFVGGIVTLASLILHICIGSYAWYSPAQILSALVGNGSEQIVSTLWDLRLPRALAAGLVGGTLGITGAMFQAALRNSLSDPFVLGSSSGAALGGALALILGFAGAFGGLGLMLAAGAGGILVLTLSLLLAKRFQPASATTLLLGGMAVGSMVAGLLSVLLILAKQDANRVLRWLFGSTSSAEWIHVPWLLGALVVALVVAVRKGRALNALALGEATAAHLGVDLKTVIPALLATGTLATSISVGCVGMIGFVGLIAPHMARLLVGADMRRLAGLAGMVGATMLLLSDILAQRLVGVIEIPVGAVTAALGAPFFLWILSRKSD